MAAEAAGGAEVNIRDAIVEAHERRLNFGASHIPEATYRLAVELFRIEPECQSLRSHEQWERDACLVREALRRLREDGALGGDYTP